MGGMTLRWATELVQGDVERVKTEAIAWINASSLELTASPNPRLPIVAIIGPGAAGASAPPKIRGMAYSEAVLCEVGIGKGRPYVGTNVQHAVRTPEGKKWVAKRRKWFFLTEEQYRAVAPALFAFLQRRVDEKTAAWKFGPHRPFRYHIEEVRWKIRTHDFQQRVRTRVPRYGMYFTVSAVDELLARDIYCAELTCNPHLKRTMAGLANYMHACLRTYNTRFAWERFCALKGVGAITRRLHMHTDRLPTYLLAEMLTWHFPEGTQYRFWPELLRLVGWDGKKTPQAIAASHALPGIADRIGNMVIFVVAERPSGITFKVCATDLDGSESKDDGSAARAEVSGENSAVPF